MFLLAIGLWIASYGSLHLLHWASHGPAGAAAVSRGMMRVEIASAFDEPHPLPESAVEWSWVRLPTVDLRDELNQIAGKGGSHFGGFFFDSQRGWGIRMTVIYFPLPFLVALFAPLPLVDLIRIRRRRRRVRRLAAGLCVRCGYDLRATPQKCPECGAVPIAPPV